MTKRILIVEDNPIEAREISLIVQQAGFHAEVSDDAEQGFERLTSQHFDAVLCDLHLPGQNGFTFCRRVKQSEVLRSAPVVLLTRHADPLNFLRGLEAGADGFISKEQSPTNICERLKRVLARQDAVAQNLWNETDRVVFLETEFEITPQRDRLLEVLLSGFEDVVLLNSKYEEETDSRVRVQKELRDANAMYLSLVETLPAGLIRKDIDGHYTFANSMACEILGRHKEEIIGKTDFDLLPESDAEEQRAHDRYVLETGHTHDDCIRHDDPRSGKRSFILRRSPVRDSEGRIVGTQVLWSDVTEFKRAESELIRAKKAAEEASLAKSQFLSAMSHELRTPLNGVIGMTELLAGTDLSEKQQQFVDACRNSGEALLYLINDILDFSKIEAGKLELDLHDFDLEKLVTDTVDTMAWRALDKALEIPCFVDRMTRTILKGDSNRLRQILVNLIGNAIKFTEAGEVVVRAKTVGQQDHRLTVRFSVSDTGIGIPFDKLDRLFQSFSQVDSETTRTYGGTGLGLAISQSLVELMGGTIGVESELGKGSTFWFEVPFALVSSSREFESGQSRLAGLRALIVDDNETNRTILAEYASGWGLTSITAASVDEALAVAERAEADRCPFRIVLTDYNMPERNGLELSRALKQHPQLVVLLLGSADICLDPDQMREHGIDAILRKPLRRRELYDVLCGVLVPADAVPTPTRTNSRSANGETRLSGHVLVAEDNSINRMYVVELVKQIGCTCDTVANGREALEAIQQRTYDLILMDCQMPTMDGFEATRRIRQQESDGTLQGHLPIIALTANAVRGDRQRCLDAGMDDYLSKPVQQKEVTKLLARFLSDAAESPPEARDSNDQKNIAPEDIPIHAESLLARCFGNLEFAESLLAELASTGMERVEEIRKHVAQQDAAAAADAAHALKGAAGILCAESVKYLAARIERAGRLSNFSEAEGDLIHLAAEMQQCLNYLPHLRHKLALAKDGA